MSLVLQNLSVLKSFVPQPAAAELADALHSLASCFSQAPSVKPFSMSLEELKDK